MSDQARVSHAVSSPQGTQPVSRQTDAALSSPVSQSPTASPMGPGIMGPGMDATAKPGMFTNEPNVAISLFTLFNVCGL